jgi:transposase
VQLFLEDGRIEMDINAVERAMRPTTLTQRMPCSLSATRAPRIALLASLIETCKGKAVSAEHWLADVLAKFVYGWPAARLDELLPWAST